MRILCPELLKRPQVIAANKMDAVYAEEDTDIIVDELRKEFEPKGIKVFPISAVSRKGVKELLYHINDLLKTVDDAPGFVLPYGDSPMDREQVGERVYLDILNQARNYVHIMTPYLILDDEMVNALSYAAKRGIDVKLIMPHIPGGRASLSSVWCMKWQAVTSRSNACGFPQWRKAQSAGGRSVGCRLFDCSFSRGYPCIKGCGQCFVHGLL